MEVQEKKVKKISDMNIDPFKAVGNGGVTSSSGSSTPTPYLANGENADKSYHSLSNDFSFPPRGISSLYLPARGLRSLAVAYQEVPDGWKESSGSAWQFIGLMPLFGPPRHDSAETITRALNVGVNVKMITGDQLAIAKETGRRLGMGTNMYPSSALLGQHKDESIAALPVDELIEKADGFAGVFPEHKYEIVKRLQARKHICGMTGDGVNDAPALKKADIGIAVADATDAARSASDIVLTEPGLSVIISAVLTSRAIFQRMKNYTIYAVSITIPWFYVTHPHMEVRFPTLMVLIIAILNDGTIMTISKDRVKSSPQPNSWKLLEIFATGIILGSYLAMMTVIFFWAAYDTDIFHVYIEFYDAMSMPMPIALSGHLLFGQPVMVKPSEAEKNLVQTNASGGGSVVGSYGAVDRKLYVGNLHFSITVFQLKQGAVDGSVFQTFWWPVMDSRCIICRNLVSNVRKIFGSGHLLRKGGRVCLRIQRCRWRWLACGGGNAQGVQRGGSWS
ncbi:unnamed protein product [Camellia sinensis]